MAFWVNHRVLVERRVDDECHVPREELGFLFLCHHNHPNHERNVPRNELLELHATNK